MTNALSETVPVTQQVVVLSDLHITPAVDLGNFTAGDSLVRFTRQLNESASPDAILVLAGDVIDFLLLEDRPKQIDLATASLLVQETLDRLHRDSDWAAVWRDELRTWRESGRRIVLIPGNHDPEWHHPGTSAVLARWLTGKSDSEPIEVWRRAGPWQAKVGRWDVVVGHGHRADPINDIDPNAIHEALRTGVIGIPLPPGSELVLGPLSRFKRAMDPATGLRRFAFLDRIKPEVPVVPFLLMYLDGGMFRNQLLPATQPLFKAFLRHVNRRLRGGHTLSLQDGRGSIDMVADQLASCLVECFTDSERSAASATVERLKRALDAAPRASDADLPAGSATSSHDRLAFHGGPMQALIRSWVRNERATARQFFDSSEPDSYDQRIIDEWLSVSSGPMAVIAGHSHAARQVQRDSEHVYLNSGTWTNLLDLSSIDESDASLQELIDQLESNSVPLFQRLSWAEVTADRGPQLHEWNG